LIKPQFEWAPEPDSSTGQSNSRDLDSSGPGSGCDDAISDAPPSRSLGNSDIPGGVIIDAAIHAQVLERVLKRAQEAGLVARGLTYSPLKGPRGNIEFLFWASLQGKAASIDANEVVMTAHQRLD